jgi:hypothetical protein
MHHELWDTKSGNLLDDYASESEALDALADLIAANTPGMARDLVLLRVGGPDEGASIASGAELARRVQAIASLPGQLVE